MPGGLGPLMMDVAGPALDGEDRDLALHPAIGGGGPVRTQLRGPRAACRPQCRAARAPVAAASPRGRSRGRPGAAVPHRIHRSPRCPVHRRRPRSRSRVGAGTRASGGPCRGPPSCGGRASISISRRPGPRGGTRRSLESGPSHADPGVVAELARSWLDGAACAGFAGVGKHFPGHGTARGDTHVDGVVDARSLAELRAARSPAVCRSRSAHRRRDDRSPPAPGGG